ncbi:aldehyde dehydrogenase [Allobranchiibius sp. CTAmp26]|uniref:aldehyde dehydrogenase family protein n=1 Tax=Allobranchiibius sp. CTAmp26 TaxID=2815214 RepID=UPI001AA1238E|nr:aldehyde dehydrogenase family protein [Allobranchiibius sp. CTAmp26]MBO1754146.1 aldehyde dehydrogenase [Allobranchiibius sp. CTAmp26]
MSTTYDVINPSTGRPFRAVQHAGLDEVDAVVARAHAAAPAWARVDPADRGRLLRRFADVVDAHLDELADLEIENAGHTRGNATWEAGNVRDVLHYYAAAPERLCGKQIPVAGGIDLTFQEPLGVVGVIVPWNFPMPVLAWGVGPALAAGNTVVVKPAELTPFTALRLAELALEAGLPEGVLNVVPGEGPVVGQRFVTHPDVRKVCFTGSTTVGKRLMALAAGDLTRVTLELGGKSANIVFDDCDVDAAAAAAPGAVFDNAGQDCCARSRILVQRSVFDRFMENLEPAVRAVRVLDPSLDANADMGPLISSPQRQRVRRFVEDADSPVQIAFRGAAPDGAGWWYPPTVVLPTGTRDPLWQEEIFGPVVSVLPFEDEADAIAMANDTAYGLAGSIWTDNLGRGLRVARGVRAGNLSVNSHSAVRYSTPFGGYKSSGLGRELGPDALDAFTETKNVFISTAP